MKKFIIKLLLFSLLIFLGQFVICLKFKPEKNKHVQLLTEYSDSKVHIIGLGDSTINHSYDKDVNKQSTYSMLQNLLKNDSLREISSAAFHAGVYEHYFRYIAQNIDSVHAVIMPINLRSFSPQWDMRPAYGFEKSKAALKYDHWIFYMFHKPLLIFKFFEPKITEFEYKNTAVFNGNKKIGKVKDFLTENYDQLDAKYIRDKFQFHYMYKLEPTHRKLQSIRNIIALSKRYDIQAMFYITPIDFEQGNRFLGLDFLKQIRRNTLIIHRLFKQEGVPLLDLSTSLDRTYFYWLHGRHGDHSPNEHLIANGRQFVAQQIYSSLNRK